MKQKPKADNRVKCPRCDGTGDLYYYDYIISKGCRIHCSYCRGFGKVSLEEQQEFYLKTGLVNESA